MRNHLHNNYFRELFLRVCPITCGDLCKIEYSDEIQNKDLLTLKEKKIGPATIRLLQGDLTSCEVDGVINVTGKTLIPQELDEEHELERLDLVLNQIEQDMEPNDVPIMVTDAEHLKANHVLNAPTVDTTVTSGAHKIRKTMRSLLEEAQAKKLKSLALPAIGSGVKRYPLERCAEILLQELAKSVSREDNSIERVIFVLGTQKSYRIFEQVLENFEQE